MSIAFSKPDITKLKSRGYTVVDMHVHTNASPDCLVDLQSILKKAKERSIGIAITDHDKITSAVSTFNNNLGVLVIPGIEVFAKSDRHVLFYFYNKRELISFYQNEVKGKFLSKSVDELLELKQKYDCVVGIAHPTGHEAWHNYGINYDIRKVDFIEVLNGNCSKRRAIKLANWAEKYKIGITAGSDAHILEDLGRCLTCSKGKTIKEVLDSIEKKENFVVGLPISRKRSIKRLPRDIFKFGLWVLAKVYYYAGVKSLVKRHTKK